MELIYSKWINGFKNKGAPLVKEWLLDIKKFKYYKELLKKE